MAIQLNLSVRAVCLGDDLRKVAPTARALGFAGLQLDLNIGGLALYELDGSGRREVKHMVSRDGLEIESVRGQVATEALVRAADHDRLLWQMRRAMEATLGIGAKCLCVDVGRLPGVAPAKAAPRPIADPGLIILPETPKEQAPEPAVDPAELELWNGVDVLLRELGTMADRIGVMVAFSTELSSFASLGRMLGGAKCQWFGVDLDPVGLLRDNWSAERVLDELGGWLRHMRVRDGVKGSAGRTQPAGVGAGSTNWQELLGLLDQGAFAGWLTVDTVDLPDRAGQARAALEVLNKAYH